MGYTHYFKRKPTLEKEPFNKFIEDVKQIFAHAKRSKKVTLVNGAGEKGTKPIANEKVISFNGVDNGKIDNSHETMQIPLVLNRANYDKGPLLFDFCKTARKPYDKYVTAVLVAFKHHFPHAEISSDGDKEDFESGQKICIKLFGYGLDFKMRGE